MKVKIKKLIPEAIIPSYAKLGDAGMDLTATSGPYDLLTDDEEGSWGLEYKTGLAIAIPEGYVGLIFPRSSISKKDLLLANSVGVIDSEYRGEIKCRFKITGTYIVEESFYKAGDKIAQLIIVPFPTIELEESDELSETERGEGGFGHTGK